mgnify:CR=1 FL=1
MKTKKKKKTMVMVMIKMRRDRTYYPCLVGRSFDSFVRRSLLRSLLA